MFKRAIQRFHLHGRRHASCLVIAEHNNAALGEATVLVAGKDCKAAADEAAKLAGVTKVVVADSPALEFRMPETFAPFISTVAPGYSHVFAGASSFGKNIIPRAAVLNDVAPISDITAIESEDTFIRPMYAGNAMATVQSSDPIKYVSV